MNIWGNNVPGGERASIKLKHLEVGRWPGWMDQSECGKRRR